MRRRSIKTRRLEIRPYKRSDYKAWYDTCVHALPKQSTYDSGPIPASKCTKKEFSAKIRRYSEKADADIVYVWGVFERKTGLLIGVLDIAIISRDVLQIANLGYRVFNRYWRKGYAKEFVSAGIRLALKDLKLNRLEAVIDLDNRASIRLAKSVGMEREGIRKSYYYQFCIPNKGAMPVSTEIFRTRIKFMKATQVMNVGKVIDAGTEAKTSSRDFLSASKSALTKVGAWISHANIAFKITWVSMPRVTSS